MQTWRVVYLVFVLALAVAHVVVTLSPWTSPVWGMVTGYQWFVVMFAGWLLAGVLDLALSLLRVMPLSYAVEAVVAMLSLAILMTGPGLLALVLACALVAPAWVGVKAIEELSGRRPVLQVP